MNLKFDSNPPVGNHILSGSSWRSLYRLLKDNGFDVEPKHRLRLLKSLLIVFISFPVYLLEKLLFNSRIKKTTVHSPVFILGYPRSGTTNLIYLLSNDNRLASPKTYECLTPHIFFLFGSIIRAIAEKALPNTRPMDNMALGADLPKEEEFALANMGIESMANALYFPLKFSEYVNRFVLFKNNESEKRNWKRNHKFFLQKISLKNKGKPLLLKSPFNTGRIKEILELYPDARFIHIYRNPLAVYSSNEKLYEGVLPLLAFKEISNEAMGSHVLYSYKVTYEKYFREKHLIPQGHLVEFSYEKFIGNELSCLEEVYTKLNFPSFNQARDKFKEALQEQKNYTTNRHHLPETTERRVLSEWHFAFEKLGYEKKN